MSALTLNFANLNPLFFSFAGAVFDFCNDNDDGQPTQGKNYVRVISEKPRIGNETNDSGVQNNDVIDLCDSDDDEENTKLPASGAGIAAVKEESCMI